MNNLNEIPKVIHYTWKDENIPAHFNRFIETWKHHHPEWQFCLWTDKMNRSFVQQYFPNFIKDYDGYEHNIQRVDAVRYLILFHQGGVFIDLDIECLKNISPLLKGATCVFSKEPQEHCVAHKKLMIISNAFMACIAGHPFMGKICSELENYNQGDNVSLESVLESTGPFMLTNVFQQYSSSDVCILEHNLMFGLTKSEIRKLIFQRTTSEDINRKRLNSFGVHYYWGTWWQKSNILSAKESFFLKQNRFGW